MTVIKKNRPRRIAADEAHAWARNLRLGNHMAKDVLKSAAMYVNGEGVCFVGIEQLADDTELSMDTVRKRLAWLESIGAIVRFPQWIDANGRRNGEARGKRTTDEIRFLLDADPDEIEARANGETDASEAPGSPSHQQGPNQGQDSVSPTVALCQPSDSGEGLDSSNLEPEPEKIPPSPPSGGERVIDEELEKDIEEFRSSYPAPITDMPRFRSVMTALTSIERTKIVTAAKGYATYIADLEKKGRGRNVKNAHLWVQNGHWQGFVTTGERAVAAALVEQAPIDSETGKAWSILHKIAHITPLESAGRYYIPRPLTPQALALAQAPPEDEWKFVPPDKLNQCGAWKELIRDVLADRARPELVWDRNPGGRRGFYAPWDWPPRKDGSINTGPPKETLSDDDLQAFH